MSADRIRENLRRLAGEPLLAITGTVKAVNRAAATCDVDPSNGGGELLDVRLRALIDDADDGLLSVPAIGAEVLMVPLDEHRWAVVLASELAEVQVKLGDTLVVVKADSVTLDAAQLTLNEGKLGGLVKAKVLAQELNKNNQLLQALLLIVSGAPIPEPGNGAPSAFQTALASAVVGKVLGDFSQLENEKITH
jgi:hypothetical protein